MLIIPAIDLKDGKCVRLKQGVLEDATIFSEDPGAMAAHWGKLGARRLHVDGVRSIIIAGQVPTWAPVLPILVGRDVLDRERRA